MVKLGDELIISKFWRNYLGAHQATDLADYLVKKGVAFRDAHEIVGKAVALGVAEEKDLSELTLE